jgi:hypothetical protein
MQSTVYTEHNFNTKCSVSGMQTLSNLHTTLELFLNVAYNYSDANFTLTLQFYLINLKTYNFWIWGS